MALGHMWSKKEAEKLKVPTTSGQTVFLRHQKILFETLLNSESFRNTREQTKKVK